MAKERFQVYLGLSELFSRLQDGDKSARYAAKAYDMSRSLQLADLNSRNHRYKVYMIRLSIVVYGVWF